MAVAALMADGFDLQAIGFVAPEIARGWGLELAAFAPVFSAALAGSIVGALLAGPAATYAGERLVLALALALFGVGTLITPLSNDLRTLVQLRFVVGIGLGATVPLLMAIVAAHSPARLRATLVTIALCGQPVGAIAGAALCARFIPTYGWQFAFWLGGVLPLLLIGAVFLIPRSMATALVGERNGAHWRDLLGDRLLPTTLLLWASAFLTVFFIYIIINWLPGSLRAVGYTLETSVLAISLFNFGGIAGALLFSALMGRYPALRIVPMTFLLAAASMMVLDVARAAPTLLLAAAFLTGVSGYGGSMSMGALATVLYPPALRASGVGWMLGVGRIGAAIGPVGAGFALSLGMEIGRLFYFAAAAAAAVAICLLMLARLSPEPTGAASS